MVHYLDFFRFTICLLSTLQLAVHSLSVLKEYCPGELLTASCAEDEVLVVRSAVYGRMRSSRCLRNSHDGHPVCRANVLRYADRLCSGRRSCRVHVADSVFGSPTPCHQSSAKMYLEVIYECLKVLMPTRASDCSVERQLTTNQPFGYLSNFAAEEYGYGSVSCPWRIALSTGERVNITLIDFFTPQADSRVDAANGFQHCPLYALLTESSATAHSFRVCGGDRRERNVFISRTNIVEVKIIKKPNALSMTGADKDVFFLLQFEAIGCPEPEPPRFGWSLRDGDGVLMGCNHSRVSWRLICDGTRWTGHIETCSAVVERSEKRLMVWGNVSIPFTVSIIVMAALAVIAVIIILLISLLCIEWQKGNRGRLRRRSKLVGHDETSAGSTGSTHAPRHQPLGQGHNKTPIRASLSTGHLDPHSSSSSSSQANLPSAAATRSTDPKGGDDPTTPSATPRTNRPSNDYVKEMWPMVAAPHGNPGEALLLRGDAQPNNSGAAMFQYGDLGSLTLTLTSGAQNGRGRCQSMMITDSEDDTHIYETPKYLRREKAATMRLKGSSAQCHGSEEHRRSEAEPQAGVRYASKTLPREINSSINKNKRT